MELFVRRLSNVFVSKWFVVILALLLLFCLNNVHIESVSAVNCQVSWGVELSTIKSNYQPGESISGSYKFQLNNATCPSCIQQIVIGLVGQSGGRAIVGPCIYNGVPKVCPEYTSGYGTFNFTAPNDPGTYRIIACNFYQYSCIDAQQRFPAAPNYTKELTSITVSVRPPPPPPPPPPVITAFTASTDTINAGQSSTLQWNVTGVTSVSINQGIGTVSSSGTKVVTPTATTTYTLTAINNAGSKTATTKVTVTAPPPNHGTEEPEPPDGIEKIIEQIKEGIAKIPEVISKIQDWIGQAINIFTTIVLPLAILVVIALVVWKYRYKLPRPWRPKGLSWKPKWSFEAHGMENEQESKIWEEIKNFRPRKHYRREEGYQKELYEHLKDKFTQAEQKVIIEPGAIIDIKIDKIGIEIKGPTRASDFRRLVGQILSYEHGCTLIYVVLFKPQFNSHQFNHHLKIPIQRHLRNKVGIITKPD